MRHDHRRSIDPKGENLECALFDGRPGRTGLEFLQTAPTQKYVTQHFLPTTRTLFNSTQEDSDALKAMLARVESKLDEKEEEELSENDTLIEQLKKEVEVMTWIVKLDKLGPNKQGDSLKEEEELWGKIKENYRHLHVNLRQVLTPRLVLLRKSFGFGKEDKSYWDVQGRFGEFDEDIDWEKALKNFK